MAKYRKKPVEVEAIRWTGDKSAIKGFVNERDIIAGASTLQIHTLEGAMIVWEGDYIVKGIHGEVYPVKPDIFEKTYEKVV